MPPRFVSPGALARNEMEAFLLRQAEDERREAALVFEQQRRAEELALRREQEQRIAAENQQAIEARTATATAATEQRRQSEATETARRQDAAGVRQMMATMAGGDQPLTPDRARAISLIGFTEGVPVPGIVDQALKPVAPPKEPDAFTLGPGQRRYDATGKLIASVAPEARGGGDGQAGPASPAETYQERGANRLSSALDELEAQVSPYTVGTARAAILRAAPLPGNIDPTVNFDSIIEQIKALIGFDELNRMRQASRTGGALGQVSNQEIAYLQSVAGSLNPNQSEDAFRRQLGKVRTDIQRVVDFGLGAPARSGGPGAGPAAPARPSAADLIKKYSRP